MNPLKEALAKRRGKGMEVDIAVAAPKEKPAMEMATEETEMSKLEQLAELVKDNPEASALVAEMLSDQTKEMGAEESEHEGMDEELTDGMSDYEKEDTMGREKPRSLGERAKKAALERMKK